VKEASVRIGGVAYDPQRQTVYLLQMQADQDGYEYRPLVHALKMNVPAPATEPAPAPAPSARATAVTLTANVPSPQHVGATITWTAQPAGGAAPYEYKWFAFSNGGWNAVSGWVAANAFQWTPTSAAADGRFGVWVRSAGNTEDALEASAEQPFVITQPANSPVSAVTLTPNLSSPQAAGATIRWTAVPSGGSGSYLYKWWVNDGNTWAPVGGWVSSNTFDWAPATANANYRVGVWAKRSTNTADALEASAERPFAITIATAPKPTSVVLTTNVTAPQAPGTTITVTANAGAGAFQYKWFVNNNGWSPVSGWVTSNTYQWTPTSANANYILGVWVRSATSTVDALEVSAEKPFAISNQVVITPTGPVTSVQLVSSIVPAAPGVPVVWTATPAGGAAPHQYQWWVFDYQWNPIGSWTTSNTFTWTPTTSNLNYRVGVWVRAAGSTASGAEASAEVAAPIK
jgi:hypothetical protein